MGANDTIVLQMHQTHFHFHFCQEYGSEKVWRRRRRNFCILGLPVVSGCQLTCKFGNFRMDHFHFCQEYRNVKVLYGREEKRKRRGRVHIGEELASSWTPGFLL